MGQPQCEQLHCGRYTPDPNENCTPVSAALQKSFADATVEDIKSERVVLVGWTDHPLLQRLSSSRMARWSCSAGSEARSHRRGRARTWIGVRLEPRGAGSQSPLLRSRRAAGEGRALLDRARWSGASRTRTGDLLGGSRRFHLSYSPAAPSGCLRIAAAGLAQPGFKPVWLGADLSSWSELPRSSALFFLLILVILIAWITRCSGGRDERSSGREVATRLPQGSRPL